jgi:hypothetical protein
VATVAVSTEPSVITPGREPGRLRIALKETVGYFGTWLRLLWRHWPVLVSLAFAGTIARQVLIDKAVDASAWHDGLGGFLVYPLVPMAMLVPMVLMFRVMRPSLPYLGGRGRPEPVLVYFASVLLPFLVFYVAADYAKLDFVRYGLQVANESSLALLAGVDTGQELFPSELAVAVIAVLAFVVRWVLNRLGAVRRFPLLALPAVYLEVLWIFAALFTIKSDYAGGARQWLADSRAGQATLRWWASPIDTTTPLGAALSVGRSAASSFLDSVDLVLLAPVSALVAGSVVLAARARRPVREVVDESRLKRVFRVGVAAGKPVGGRLALLADGIRRVFQAGVLATMIFCLSFVALGAVSSLLFEPVRVVVGPQSVERIWAYLYFPLQWTTDAIELVLIMALIAAFVDRTAARIARRAGAPVSVPASAAEPAPTSPAPAPNALANAFSAAAPPEQATTRLGPPPGAPGFGLPAQTSYAPGAQTSYAPPPPAPPLPSPRTPLSSSSHPSPPSGPYAGPIVGAAPGTPTFGGISPVTATYTTPVEPPSTFGSVFTPPPALPAGPRSGTTPVPPGPAATPPPGLTSGLWDDGKPDVPGKPVDPGDPDGGWTTFGR